MAKHLTSVRRGIQYQDLVAAEALLDMIFHNDQEIPLWVSLENRAGGTFDDVVVGYPGRVVWRQVKGAANPGAEPLTIASLAAVDPRRKKSLIAGFAESYRKIIQSGSSFELELVTTACMQLIASRIASRVRSKDARLIVGWSKVGDTGCAGARGVGTGAVAPAAVKQTNF